MENKPFNKVENQIGFCGIWCGSCPGGNGSITELTRRYEDTVRKNNLSKWAPKDFDFKEFMKGLSSLQRIPTCPGCLRGGGSPDCAIRKCANQKALSSCSQCSALASCRDFESLEKRNPTIRQDLQRVKNTSQNELIDKWKLELKTKFPHCLILCNSSQA